MFADIFRDSMPRATLPARPVADPPAPPGLEAPGDAPPAPVPPAPVAPASVPRVAAPEPATPAPVMPHAESAGAAPRRPGEPGHAPAEPGAAPAHSPRPWIILEPLEVGSSARDSAAVAGPRPAATPDTPTRADPAGAPLRAPPPHATPPALTDRTGMERPAPERPTPVGSATQEPLTAAEVIGPGHDARAGAPLSSLRVEQTRAEPVVRAAAAPATGVPAEPGAPDSNGDGPREGPVPSGVRRALEVLHRRVSRLEAQPVTEGARSVALARGGPPRPSAADRAQAKTADAPTGDVRIGQIDVVVTSPSPARAGAAPSPGSDSRSSRRYLRNL